MAASLNPPSHFVTVSTSKGVPSVDMKRTDLQPPSSFEKVKSADPYQSLAEATQQILELKSENQKLRTSRHALIPTGEVRHIKARVDIHHAGRHTDILQYHHSDIITKQAMEIAQLKAESKTRLEQHFQEIRDLKEALSLSELDHKRRILDLESQLKVSEDANNREVSSMKDRLEKERSEQGQRLGQLQEELESTRVTYQHQVEDLQTRLQSQDTEHQSGIEMLQHQLSLKETEAESLQAQLTQLKTYLGDTLPSTSTTTAWKIEKQQMERKINDLCKDNENNQSTIQLLNVRLSSVNEILAIQEAEVSKNKSEIVDSSCKKTQSLLNKWREKVFSLMVQQKSQDIVSKKDNNNYISQISGLEDELESCQNECAMMQHALTDKDAELQMQISKYKSLQEEFSSVQQIATILDNKLQESEQVLNGMKSFVASVAKRNGDMESTLQAAFTKLSSYEKRIDFACSRIHMLQGLLARKETVWKMRMEELINQQPERDEVKTDKTTSPSLEIEQITLELERVTRERDSLAVQIHEDNTIIQQHTQNTKKKVEEERSNVSGKYVEKLAEMEKRVNEVRREHTKAVVSLRQMERQLAREKERSNERLKTQEDVFQKQLSKLQSHLKDIEKDRNLLMATLRQEGLIGKYKGMRSTAATGSSTGLTEMSDSNGKTKTERTEQVSMETVVEDLQALTAAILDGTTE
ncbi:coiled-coil alpha-helical rod protein 1-like [Glandiceps talaboti]